MLGGFAVWLQLSCLAFGWVVVGLCGFWVYCSDALLVCCLVVSGYLLVVVFGFEFVLLMYYSVGWFGCDCGELFMLCRWFRLFRGGDDGL